MSEWLYILKYTQTYDSIFGIHPTHPDLYQIKLSWNRNHSVDCFHLISFYPILSATKVKLTYLNRAQNNMYDMYEKW